MIVWMRGEARDVSRRVSLHYLPDQKVRLLEQPEEPGGELSRTVVGRVQQIALVRG